MLAWDKARLYEQYHDLITEIFKNSFNCDIYAEADTNQSLRIFPTAEPERGRSFSVTRQGDIWYVCLWPHLPEFYFSTNLNQISELCLRILSLMDEGKPTAESMLAVIEVFSFCSLNTREWYQEQKEYWHRFYSAFGWQPYDGGTFDFLDAFDDWRTRHTPERVLDIIKTFDPPSYPPECRFLHWSPGADRLATLAMWETLQSIAADEVINVASAAGASFTLRPRLLLRKPYEDYWALSPGPCSDSKLFAARDHRWVFHFDASEAKFLLYGSEFAGRFAKSLDDLIVQHREFGFWNLARRRP